MLLGIWLIIMIVGFFYLRFVVGAKGYEQILLYSYYQELGNLEAVSDQVIKVVWCNDHYRMVVILCVDQEDQFQHACTSHRSSLILLRDLNKILTVKLMKMIEMTLYYQCNDTYY